MGALLRHLANGPTTLVLVITIGVAGRIASLSGGFPEVFYRDEDDVVESALYTITGDLNPHVYKYPSLLSSILGAAFHVALAHENLRDPETVSAVFARFQEDPVRLTITARAVALAPLHLDLSRAARVDGLSDDVN